MDWKQVLHLVVPTSSLLVLPKGRFILSDQLCKFLFVYNMVHIYFREIICSFRDISIYFIWKYEFSAEVSNFFIYLNNESILLHKFMFCMNCTIRTLVSNYSEYRRYFTEEQETFSWHSRVFICFGQFISITIDLSELLRRNKNDCL